MGIGAFFFDIDGTLVDSNGLHVLAWHEAFSQYGHEVAHATIRKQIGKGADMLLPALLPNSDPALRKALETAHGQIFRSRYLRQVKPFRRASELQNALRPTRRRVRRLLKLCHANLRRHHGDQTRKTIKEESVGCSLRAAGSD